MKTKFKKILISPTINYGNKKYIDEIINSNPDIPSALAECGKGYLNFNRNTKEAKDVLLLSQRSDPRKYIKHFLLPPSLKGTVCRSFIEFIPMLNCKIACEMCYLYKTDRNVPLCTQYIDYNNMYRVLKEFVKDPLKFAPKNKPKYKPKSPYFFNTGELADSLSWDDITGFSKKIVPFFGNELKDVADHSKKKAYLLFGTKSDNIENLLDLEHNKRTIVFFSINSDQISKKILHGAAKPEKQVKAAKKLEKAGYPIEFRFDPLFREDELFNGHDWKKEYSKMAELVISETNPIMITLGAYRPDPTLRGWIKRYFKNSPLLNLKVSKQGGKYRIKEEERKELIDFVLKEIRKYEKKCNKKIPVSFCKETVSFWKNSLLKYKGNLKCNCVPF